MGTAEKDNKDVAWEWFIEKHKARIQAYQKTHKPVKGKTKLPVLWDGKEWHWVTRKDIRSGRVTK